MNNNLKETQVMQIIITVFYGQFLSTAVFENIIGAIPDLVRIYKYLGIKLGNFYLGIKFSQQLRLL